jgi:signal transduction histidine kinase
VHGLSVELFAHDLRSPLLASRREVLNLLHGSRSSAIPGREHDGTLELLERLERSLERIDHLMVDILELASLPVVEMPRETFLASELVESVLEQCSDGSRLRWRVPSSLSVTGNPTLLVRALLNLVENALRHTTGPVLIDLNRAADGLLMLVDDHGPGVPAELRDVIFEPLARIDPESSLGAGLGLTLVRRVAEAHGGLAGVEEAPTGGARFVLWVPQASVIRRRGSVVPLGIGSARRR